MTADRLQCVVPFCRRTMRANSSFSEWICAGHWRLIDRDLRRLHTKASRAFRHAEAECEAIEREGRAMREVPPSLFAKLSKAAFRREKKLRQAHRLWERCKRQAIERAFGGGEGL